MKNVLLALLLSLSFLGCSDEVIAPVESKSVVGGSLESLSLNDQFEKPHTLEADTKKVIFAFSKDMGHMSNAFFEKQSPTYLTDHKAVFVADVSGAPSLIRSMFIMPGLKDFKHTVLIIEEKPVAAAYRDNNHTEELMILDVDNFIIKKIEFVKTEEALQKAL